MIPSSKHEMGRKMFSEIIPTAPIELYDEISQGMRDWYIEEANRRAKGGQSEV